MGRPSKLSLAQWETIGKRINDGEKRSALAVEFGLERSTIDFHFAKRRRRRALALSLPAPPTATVPLRAICGHLANAAGHGAATAERLFAIAHARVNALDAIAPPTAEFGDALKHIAALMKVAHDASEIGLNWLRANKGVPLEDDAPTPVAISFGVQDAAQAPEHVAHDSHANDCA